MAGPIIRAPCGFRVEATSASAVYGLDVAIKVDPGNTTPLNFTDLGSPFGAGDPCPSSTPTPNSMSGGGGGGGPANGGGGGASGSTGGNSDMDQHHHHGGGLGSVTPGPQGGNGGDSASSTPVSHVSKSAFIELQHNNPYNTGLRGGYPGGHNVSGGHQFSHQVSGLGHQGTGPGSGNQQHADVGFPSPRSTLAGYPFGAMHQHNAYGYHIGSYPQCPSPPKDNEYPNCMYFNKLFI